MWSNQPILRGYERTGKESKAETKVLVMNRIVRWFTTDLARQFIAERCVIDEIIESPSDCSEDMRTKARPVSDRFLHLLFSRQLHSAALHLSEPTRLQFGERRDGPICRTNEPDEAKARTNLRSECVEVP